MCAVELFIWAGSTTAFQQKYFKKLCVGCQFVCTSAFNLMRNVEDLLCEMRLLMLLLALGSSL